MLQKEPYKDKNPQIVSAERAYDLLAEKYDVEYNTTVARVENETVFAMVRKAGCDRGHVLDLGCGTGLFLEYCPIGLRNYTGIDVSSGMLAVARKKFPGHAFYQADMADLSFLPAGSLGSVVSLFASFAYALEPERVIAEIGRLLAPGGRFFVMTLGPRYGAGRPEILAGLNVAVPWRMWEGKELRRQFEPIGRTRLRGMRAVSNHRLGRLPYRLMRAYRGLETAIVGRAWPAGCDYQIVSGAKRCVA